MLAEVRTFTTKKGEQMAFCRLEDLQGSVDVTVFPQLFRDKRDLWKQDKIVIVWGKPDARNGRMSVVADRAQDYVQGQRIIEDTTTVFHRYQNGNGQAERPVVRANGIGAPVVQAATLPAPRPENGRSKVIFAGGPVDDGQDDEALDYSEANPFAARGARLDDGRSARPV